MASIVHHKGRQDTPQVTIEVGMFSLLVVTFTLIGYIFDYLHGLHFAA